MHNPYAQAGLRKSSQLLGSTLDIIPHPIFPLIERSSMDAEALDRKLEIMSGHIEAMRVMVIATAILAPNREELQKLYRELLDSQRELLQCQSVSDEFLEGLDLAGETMLKLISPSQS